MDNTITETILVDCSSLNSEEQQNEPNKSLSLFTNSTDSIVLKAGDKISVEQAFISELGAGADAVEFDTNFLENRNLLKSNIIQSRPINGCNTKILGYEIVDIENSASQVRVQGNKTSISIGFYKSNNGENCFALPRRFAYSTNGSLSDFNSVDSYSKGYPNFEPALVDKVDVGMNGSKVQNFVCEADLFQYQATTKGASLTDSFWKLKHDNSRFQIFARKKTWYGAPTDDTLLPTIPTDSFSPSNWDYVEFLDTIDIDLPKGFSSPSNIAENITNTFRKQEQPENIELSSLSFQSADSFILNKHPISVKINSNMYKTFYCCSPRNNNASTHDDWSNWNRGVRDEGALTYLSSFQYIGVKRAGLFSKGRILANTLASSRGYDQVSKGYIRPLNNMPIANFLPDTIPSLNLGYHHIILNLSWDLSDGIMKEMSDIFLEEGKYPEIFTNAYNQMNGYTNVNNSRFFHINRFSASTPETATLPNFPNTLHNILGSDNIYDNGIAKDMNRMSCPLFIDFNPNFQGIKTDGASWDLGYNYGAFIKYTDPTSGNSYVAVSTYKMYEGGDFFAKYDATKTNASHTTIPYLLFPSNACQTTHPLNIMNTTNLGWDTHFNSYGCPCIGLMTGYINQGYNQSQFQQAYPTLYDLPDATASAKNPLLNTFEFMEEIYLGADQPVMNYSTETGRFQIEQLHTPEFVGNRYNAGGSEPLGSSTGSAEFITVEPSSGNRVYKINKRLTNSNYTPDMSDYTGNFRDSVKVYTNYAKSTSANFKIDSLNPNLSPWSIYDALGGVIIKDFGYSDKTWNEGIFGVLGFTYSQFNTSESSDNNLTRRVGNNNKTALPFAFTNADIQSGDTIDFPTNIFGAGMYNSNLPITMIYNADNGAIGGFPADYPPISYPAITAPNNSIGLTAPNLPRKLKSGYYTIRCDIIEDSSFRAKGNLYPVVAIIDKVNDTGDFYTGQSDTQFTLTRDKVITSIRTMITTPEQTLADLDRGSAVIYKITRTRPHNFNIIDEILNPQKK